MNVECWDLVGERLVKCGLEKGKHITVVGAIAPKFYQEQIADRTITHRRVKVKMMTFALAGKKPTEESEPELVLAVNEESTVPKPLSAAKTLKFSKRKVAKV